MVEDPRRVLRTPENDDVRRARKGELRRRRDVVPDIDPGMLRRDVDDLLDPSL